MAGTAGTLDGIIPSGQEPKGTFRRYQGESTFSDTFEFTNTCCSEMTLELTSSDGLTAVVPLGYPEEG